MISRAQPEDAAGIAAIWNAVIRDTVATFTTAEKTPSTIVDAIETQPFFVAKSNGTLTGFATYSQFRGGPGYAHTMEHSVHLRDGARGQGTGRALMHQLEAEAKAAGVHSLIAAISAENSDGVGFHSAIGYSLTARLPQVGRKFDRWHDLVLMQKFL